MRGRGQSSIGTKHAPRPPRSNILCPSSNIYVPGDGGTERGRVSLTVLRIGTRAAPGWHRHRCGGVRVRADSAPGVEFAAQGTARISVVLPAPWVRGLGSGALGPGTRIQCRS